MPLGMPQVPFLFPDDEEAAWIELYNRLYEERILFLGQEVDSEVSNQLVGLMVYLSLQDKTRDLYLFINSPGGEVLSGLAIFDMMQVVEAEVQTICMGLAASMGSLILLGGEITKRRAFPHAKVMMHQPASSFYEEKWNPCGREWSEIVKLQDTMVDIYCQRTGQPYWLVSQDLHRNFYMSPEEAQDYGIIDAVSASFDYLNFKKN